MKTNPITFRFRLWGFLQLYLSHILEILTAMIYILYLTVLLIPGLLSKGVFTKWVIKPYIRRNQTLRDGDTKK